MPTSPIAIAMNRPAPRMASATTPMPVSATGVTGGDAISPPPGVVAPGAPSEDPAEAAGWSVGIVPSRLAAGSAVAAPVPVPCGWVVAAAVAAGFVEPGFVDVGVAVGLVPLLGLGFAVGVGAGGVVGSAANNAVEDRELVIRSEQLAPWPAHAPLHDVNAEPDAGLAVSVTVVPFGKFAAHVAPHEIPPGVLVIVPDPVPLLPTETG